MLIEAIIRVSVVVQLAVHSMTESPWANPLVVLTLIVVSPAVIVDAIVDATLGREVIKVSLTVVREPAAFKVAGIRRKLNISRAIIALLQ